MNADFKGKFYVSIVDKKKYGKIQLRIASQKKKEYRICIRNE